MSNPDFDPNVTLVPATYNHHAEPAKGNHLSITDEGDGDLFIFVVHPDNPDARQRGITVNRAALLKALGAGPAKVQPPAPFVPKPTDRIGVGDRVRVVKPYSGVTSLPAGEFIVDVANEGTLRLRGVAGWWGRSRFIHIPHVTEPVPASVVTSTGIRRVDAPRVSFNGDSLSIIKSALLKGAFVNVVEGAKAPTLAFGDLGPAEREAERLARNLPDKRVLTLKIESVRVATQTINVEKF